ncbi:MAG: FHA domain-containing protein [Anaerolineaceae bacterium]
MGAYLEGIKGEYAGQRIELGYNQLTIGRGSTSRLRMQAPSVSREHAVIYFTNGVYAIQDRGSRLGTFVNGKCVKSAQLRSGDVITIGASSFRFVQLEQSAPKAFQQTVQSKPKNNNIAIFILMAVVLVMGIWIIASRMKGNEQEPSIESSVIQNNHADSNEQEGAHTTSQPSTSIISADYLFRDDFETGLSDEWEAEDGEWHMINGRMQPVSGTPASIIVGDSTWSNYTIEMKIGGLQNTITGASQYLENDPNIFIIGVRNSDNGAYFFALANRNQDCSLLGAAGVKTTFYKGEDYIEEEDVHLVRVDVEGNTISLYVDGKGICEFSDNTLHTGTVMISSYPGTGDEPTYPWVEEITITRR